MVGCWFPRSILYVLSLAPCVFFAFTSNVRPVSADQVRVLDSRGLQRLVAEVKMNNNVRIFASDREGREMSACAAVSPDGITVPGEVRPPSECVFVSLPSGTWQIRIDPADFQWRATMMSESGVGGAQRR